MLEFLRRAVAQRGMESHPVIVLLDEDLDVAAQVSEILIPVRLDLLLPQRFRKLSQLALSYGFACRLMLEIIWC